MAEYIKLSELEKAVFVKQTEEEKYWFDWLKQFGATKEYSVKEQAVDNFLRGYHEAVQFMLSTNEELLLKSADVVEVVHGEWIPRHYEGGICDGVNFDECSICKHQRVVDVNFKTTFNYCPNCGAKMDGERKCEDA